MDDNTQGLHDEGNGPVTNELPGHGNEGNQDTEHRSTDQEVPAVQREETGEMQSPVDAPACGAFAEQPNPGNPDHDAPLTVDTVLAGAGDDTLGTAPANEAHTPPATPVFMEPAQPLSAAAEPTVKPAVDDELTVGLSSPQSGTEEAEESAAPEPVETDSTQVPAEANSAADGTAEEENRTDNGADEKPVNGFETLGLPENILAAVKAVGFEQPSAIQAATIPKLMAGRDVVGLAQTGTGKTAAFALPILAAIDPKKRYPQALILAPTRELALQVADAFQGFADHLGAINVLPIYGGQAYGVQLAGLRRGAHVVVGTPGRIIDHLERGRLDISALKYLVLDEADEMLNMGFQEDVERILEDTPAEKQVALFSATMPSSIRQLARTYLDDPEEITVKARTRTATNIRQRFLHVAQRNKLDALTRILEVTEIDGMITFVRTKHETEELAEKLRARGFSAAAINGDMAQAQRERTVEQLRCGQLDILVATDVAARGLDVERISHVFNYDIPNDVESYVHRIGRTGRAGRAGESISFVTPREKRMLKSIERATRAHLEEMELPTVAEVNESRTARFNDEITSALEDERVALFRGLVKTYADLHDVPLEDIAAALAVKAQAEGDFFLKEEPKRQERNKRRDKRFDRDDRSRGSRSRRSDDELAAYRINVGRRAGVKPGAIVGALANEGGLSGGDFGRITILGSFSLVELPQDLDPAVLDNLADTTIAGQRIDIRPASADDLSQDEGRGRNRGGRGGWNDHRRGGRGGDRQRRYQDDDGYRGRKRYRNRDDSYDRGGRDDRGRYDDRRGGNRRQGDYDRDHQRGGGWRGSRNQYR